MDLLEQQKNLQKEAQSILEDLDLMNLLKKYGEPVIVGSMALGLMTWRDIDIEIIVDELKKEDLAEICMGLVKNFSRRLDFSVIDDRLRKNKPNSLYIGLKYFGEDIPNDSLLGANPLAWKLDLHFLLLEDAKGRSTTEELRKKLTPEKIKTILEIKNVIAKSPKHRKEIFSMDIYEAVLDRGVNSLEEFKEYLREQGKKL
jgi:hypothetical protein